MFWLSAVVLFILALAWPLYRLLKPTPAPEQRADLLNIAIYREQLDELKRDRQLGVLAENEFAEAKEELAAALAQDIKTQQSRLRFSDRRGLWLSSLLIVLLSAVIGFGLFQHLRVQTTFLDVEPSEDSQATQEALKTAKALIEHLSRNNHDAEAWDQLAQAYMQMLRPDAALQTFQRARRVGGDTPARLVGQAHALAMLQDSLAGEPTLLFQQALALDPNNGMALLWNGIAAYQQGEAAQAIGYWERLLNTLPPEHSQYHHIAGLLARAKQQQTQQPGPTPLPQATEPKAASLNVTVQLDPKLANQAQPDDTVFVLARAVNGPRMPLAIVRKRVADLPTTVVLDDSTSMSAQARLSAYSEVMVIARISPSGQAMPQPGDWFGEVGPVNPRATTAQRVLINQRVPN